MLVQYLAHQFTMDGERHTGTLGRCKKDGKEPHGGPEAVSEKLLAIPVVWLRCGPPSWVPFGRDGGWQMYSR